jgi:hypothetical protein
LFGSLKRLYFRLGERSIFVVWLLNLLIFNYKAIRKLPTRFSDRKRTYSAESDHIGTQPGAVDHNDLGLNFYVRLIIEYRYDFLIELGAFSRERSEWLAAHFPNLEVHALDITQDFQERRTVNGVRVGPNTPDHFRDVVSQPMRRGLVVSHGTLCYYSFVELTRLLAVMREFRLDLAFSEPNTIGEGSLDRSLRRTHLSHYHPYLAMLQKAGFELPDGKGHQIRDCWGEYAETRTFLFARQASS